MPYFITIQENIKINPKIMKTNIFDNEVFMGQRIYTYIQSRFYRAPEIILGIPYTTAIDMWSFGAIVAELYTGFPLFPGESEMEQLAYIMELYGVPPESVLRVAQRKDIFFTKDFIPKLVLLSYFMLWNPSHRIRNVGVCNGTYICI